ncbi:hypothetical protein EON67_04390, partial [archaeon]
MLRAAKMDVVARPQAADVERHESLTKTVGPEPPSPHSLNAHTADTRAPEHATLLPAATRDAPDAALRPHGRSEVPDAVANDDGARGGAGSTITTPTSVDRVSVEECA